MRGRNLGWFRPFLTRVHLARILLISVDLGGRRIIKKLILEDKNETFCV